MSITFHARLANGSTTPSRAEAFQFPGGEWHLRVPEGETPSHATVIGCDANDLVLLGLWADWVRSLGEEPRAHIPYLPAARADRGVPFGAKVYADLINAVCLAEVVCFDPHSPVAPDLINNCTVIDSTRAIVDHVIADHGEEFAGILAPDAGAVNRARRVAEHAGLPFFTATKTRDFATGKLTGFEAPGLPHVGRILVVDDICDGGGTFRGLAAASGVDRDRLSLWVSHGIFSGAAGDLTAHYSDVWTTDSHPGARRADVNAHVIELAPYLLDGRN